MKYHPLTDTRASDSILRDEYKAGRVVGKIHLGEHHFFFRSGYKTFYIPYSEIRRYFRRVMRVPAKMCCGRGEFQMEHIVICGDSGELAQIELPGTKAAKNIMDSLKELAPEAISGISA